LSQDADRRFRWRLVRFVGFAILGLVAFSLTIVPLLTGAHDVRAEVSGRIDGLTAQAGRPMQLPLGIDNTGGAGLDPVCVRVITADDVELRAVTFQGVDRVAFKGDVACGGHLSIGQTTSINVELVAAARGPLRVEVQPVHNGQSVGPSVMGSVEVR
jgi:hypothetical protein